METLTRCYRYRYVLFPLRNTADREFDCGSISFFRLPAYRLRLSSPGCADQGSATDAKHSRQAPAAGRFKIR
jgi:hypothetical protein